MSDCSSADCVSAKSRRAGIACAVCCLALGALADADATFTGVLNATGQTFGPKWVFAQGHVLTEFGDPASAPARTDYWGALANGAYWSDDAAPSADKTYLVTANRAVPLAAANGSQTFNGRRLILGTTPTSEERDSSGPYWSGTKSGWVTPPNGASTTTFANEGLEVYYGGFLTRNWSSVATIEGNVLLTNPQDYPGFFWASWSSPTWIFNGAVSGAATTGLRNVQAGGADNRTTIKFNGDMSGFLGKFDLRARGTACFAASATNLPGTIAVGANSELRLSGEQSTGALEVGALELTASSARVTVGLSHTTGHGTLRVANGLSIAAGAKPVLYTPFSSSVLPGYGYVEQSYSGKPTNTLFATRTLLDIPDTGVSVYDLFAVSNVQDYANGEYSYWPVMPAVTLDFVETVAGGRRLFQVVQPKVTHLVRNGSDYQGSENFAPGKGNDWYGRAAADQPDAETCYVVGNGNALFLPYQNTFVFGGRSLVLHYSSSAMIPSGYATIDRLKMMANTSLRFKTGYGAGGCHLSGHLEIFRVPSNGDRSESYYGPSSKICSDDGIPVHIYSDISGDGILAIVQMSWDPAKRNQTISFYGDNSGYRGKITIENANWAEGYYNQLCVSAKNQLGVRPAVKTPYSSIQINAGGCLTATSSFAYDVPARGIRVRTKGYVNVPDATNTLALATQLTMCGELVKIGAGTLALGGTVRYTTDQSATPLAGTNVLTVLAGAVKPLAKTATDGLAIVFGAGTKLLLDPPTVASAEMSRYGLYDCAWATPIDVSRTGGVLNVEVVADDVADWPSHYDLAVCTVPLAFAQTLKNAVAVKTPKRFGARTPRVRDNGDGTGTILTTIARTGMTIVIR